MDIKHASYTASYILHHGGYILDHGSFVYSRKWWLYSYIPNQLGHRHIADQCGYIPSIGSNTGF